jgi:ketopantoate reductase
MRDNPEEQLQAAIVQHLKLLAPKNVIWFAVPNGIPTSKRTGARFKAQGVVAGIADLCFVLADGRAAFMELKSAKGRLSSEQKAFADRCAAMGVEHVVSANIDQALSVLRAWGVLPQERNI